MQHFLDFVLPGALDRIMLAIGAVIGTVVTFAFGGWTDGLTWLAALSFTDFITGTCAAWSRHEWCSSEGAQGIKRKVFLWGFVAIAHGIDVTLAESGFTVLSFMSITVVALAVTEAGSIVENLDKMGNGRFVPRVIRRGLRAAQKAVNERMDKSFGDEEEKEKQ